MLARDAQPTSLFHGLYQCPERIQRWPAATVDAVVRVRCLAINVDQHRPAGHWRAGKQIGTRGRAGEKIGTRAVLDDDRWEKDFGLCRLRQRGVQRERLSGAIRRVCRRCSRTAAAQRLVIPTAARTVQIDWLCRPFGARLLFGHTFWRRLNVGRYERTWNYK